jgi:hypothetical protein
LFGVPPSGGLYECSRVNAELRTTGFSGSLFLDKLFGRAQSRDDSIKNLRMKDNGFKICPFCGEKIRKEAVKCRFCGEWFGQVDADSPNQQGASETRIPPSFSKPTESPLPAKKETNNITRQRIKRESSSKTLFWIGMTLAQHLPGR